MILPHLILDSGEDPPIGSFSKPANAHSVEPVPAWTGASLAAIVPPQQQAANAKMELFTELFAWWTGNTIGTRLYTWRKGERVGEDGLGNVYYQERGGNRRWVIYRSLAEPSQVPPAWHAWLHHTVDVPPTKENYQPRSWEQAHRPNLTGTYEAYRPPGSTLRAGAAKPPLDYEPWQPK